MSSVYQLLPTCQVPFLLFRRDVVFREMARYLSLPVEGAQDARWKPLALRIRQISRRISVRSDYFYGSETSSKEIPVLLKSDKTYHEIFLLGSKHRSLLPLGLSASGLIILVMRRLRNLNILLRLRQSITNPHSIKPNTSNARMMLQNVDMAMTTNK